MKIVLLGYMASGKSTIGKHLATKMFLPFLDLDQYIESKEGSTVTEIFATKGEIYFRKQEHNYLKELLASEGDFVLALGGGTPCYAGNMELILTASKTTSIFLQAGIGTLVARLEQNKAARPLVANLSQEQLYEFVGKHLFERNAFYTQANHTLVIDHKEIEEITADLRILLH